MLPACCKRGGVERDVLDLGSGEHGRGTAAGNDCLEWFVAEDSARVFEDDALQRVTGRALIDRGLLHVTGNSEQPRSGIGFISERRVRRAAVRDDPRHVGQCLHVVHHRRRLVQTPHRRKWRLVARITFAALERIEKTRLLATHISTRPAVHDDVAGKRAVENALAHEPRSAGLFERGLQSTQRQIELAAYIDECVPDVQRIGGDQHSFDELMRCVLEDPAILERAGLAFVGVAAQVDHRALLVDERPFGADREVSPAAPPQSRLRDFPLHVRGSQRLQGLFQRLVSATRTIGLERVRRVRDFEVVEHAVGRQVMPSRILSMRASLKPSWWVLSICIEGAAPQDARHSTVSNVKRPSAVVSPGLTPSFRCR